MRPVKLQLIQKVEDLGPLYWIGAEAWKEDAGFNWFFPGGRENPGHFLELWKILLQGDFFEKGMFVIAATLERDENLGRKQVVGFSVWERRGSSNAAKRWQGTTLSNKIQLLKLQLKIAKTFLFTPAAKSISLTRLRQFKSELKNVHEIQQPAECWYLHLLGVDPKAQKMGIGRKLVQWGIDRSEEENISTCLEASMAGQPLYEKLGFEENGWMSFDEGKQRQQVMRRPPSKF